MEYKNVFDNGISFLMKEQKAGGSFSSQSSSKKDFSVTTPSDTIFLTSLILSCINSFQSDIHLDKVKSKTVNFLLKQKSEHWSFNYWKKDSSETKIMPYPDDLDDTFCALAAINDYDKTTLDGAAFAEITTILTATESHVGGPYQTWIVPSNAENIWKDIDVAVNSNIAYFLALQDVFLPNMRKFLVGQIIKKNINSKYYPTQFPVAYFLSRYINLDKTVAFKYKKALQKMILSNKKNDGSFGNPLNTALATSSLLRLGISPKIVEKSIKYLNKTNKNGIWKAYAFCLDPMINKKQYYSGSKALTTAFCLEALSLFDQKTINIQPHLTKRDGDERVIYDQVIRRVKKRFTKLDSDLKSSAFTILEKTVKRDKDRQIVLLPYFFNIALGKQGKKINLDFLITLGVANIYGWIAYTIYDDFLDDEGNPKELSLANVCLRELTAIYNGIIPEEFQEVMDTLDSANAWEIANTRFNSKHYPPNSIPNYGDLAQLSNKSLGHALGPVAILIKLGYPVDSPEMKNLLDFFQHYIIARQLNDDAHDWEEDLSRGQINAVGAMILTKTKVKSKMRKIFWQEVFEDLAKIIFIHIECAQKALPALKDMLVPIERSIQKGLKEHKEAVDFLKVYSKY